MKTLMFAAALMLGGAALAQSTDPTPPEGGMAEEPMAPSPPETSMPAETPETPMTPDTPMTPEAPMDPMAPMQQPSGATVDDPSQSTGPRGVTQQGTDPNGMASPGAAPAASYPACSRTVTDSCVQTYERGRRPRR